MNYDGETVDYGSVEDLLGRILTIKRQIAGIDFGQFLSLALHVPQPGWLRARRHGPLPAFIAELVFPRSYSFGTGAEEEGDRPVFENPGRCLGPE